MNMDDLYLRDIAPASSLSAEEVRAGLRFSEQMYPVLWKKCYPRTFEPYLPNEYSSPKAVAHTMMTITQKIELHFLGQSEKTEMMWACQMARYGTPTYWVKRDLAEAVMRTTPPLTLDWYNMELPFPAMAFMLPHGFLTHKDEGTINWIAFGRFKQKDYIDTIATEGPRQWASENGALLFFANSAARYMTHWNMPYTEFPLIDLANINAMVEKYDDNHHTSGWLAAPEMTKEDTYLGGKVAHLIFGLLLLMQRKPELVTNAFLIKRVKGKKGEAPREFWSPSILGKDYTLKRAAGLPLGGTHASPRYHWVRGFWREHHFGPKRSQTKEQWIEPYERGFDD
jgi:hypothetical protein